ncbi:3-deoxy-D-manno-octulosonic acid transferase [Thiomicrospira sp. XS5]|uniref:3-deoxy-D-manno-octulosonic acid transferase n=1 Tax=Thiomicrospira sp. XS5 TaxID=1775636 RepID=UPI0007485C9E|nr:glycosyltransferase N-terminal domain-containing protein [Thiomicrospira sp. XS5]KUJ74046.1 3-deoxy-D-manno-octulosonic acid transferase [Thiomicrospira sp. XS5]
MLYQVLIRLLSPLVFMITILEAIKRHGGWRYFAQRLGLSSPQPAKPGYLWVHCASVGEVKAAEALIRRLQPDENLLVTTNTPTGAELVENLFHHTVRHHYLPLDYPYALRRFLNNQKPKSLWVVETEIWPNLYRLAHNAGVPIQLINARLSVKTLNSPDWLKRLYRETLSYVETIYARNASEAARFRTLGAETGKIIVLGNLKYAGLTPQPDFPNPIAPIAPPPADYVLAASTHAGEEEALVQLWQALKRPELLVIVPRHPRRRNRILKALAPQRTQVAVLSLNEPLTPNTQFYLYDRIGALIPLYQHAKLVIMGGAFTPKGGHNVLEPASVKACILTGPDMSDFEEETQELLDHGGLIQLSQLNDLYQRLPPLLSDAEKRQTMGQAAFDVIQQKSHILDDYLAHLRPRQSNK